MEVKWIKVTPDIFNDEKILLIESLPEADAIIVIWFKLLCLAGKMNNSGVFMLHDKIPFTEAMLATIFRRKEAVVSLALKTFEQFGMVEIVNGTITIPNWGKYQTLDQLENRRDYMRDYMQEYRKKQALLTDGKVNGKVNSKPNSKPNSKQEGVNCRPNGKPNVNSLDIDIYKKDKEEELEEEKKTFGSSDDDPSVCEVPVKDSLGEKPISEGVDTNPSEKNTVPRSNYSATFEELWKIYPRKRDKGTAYEKYKARINSGWKAEDLLAAAKAYASECRREHTEMRFIKHAATFFGPATPFIDYLPKVVPTGTGVGSASVVKRPVDENPFADLLQENASHVNSTTGEDDIGEFFKEYRK